MVVRKIAEAKAELSALIVAAQKGEDVVITEEGKPVVRLVAYREAAKLRTPGSMKGKISISPDFDRLPDDMAEAFEA